MIGPLSGLRVVEVSLGMSAVGAGMAASATGAIFRDLGADVVRVEDGRRTTLDAGVDLARSWNRDKHMVMLEGDHLKSATQVVDLASDADVLLMVGEEASIEAIGLEMRSLAKANPRLVIARIRPSHDGAGVIEDFELLVHARTGTLSQATGHRPGPIFIDPALAGAGAALASAVGALALLYERESTGVGGWVETTLLDGMSAMLAMTIGRVEHPSPATERAWGPRGSGTGDTTTILRCADGLYVVLAFGAKAAYSQFLEHIGDEPSADGYLAEVADGTIIERNARWAELFATHDRDWWLEDLAGQDFICEPVLLPGEALLGGHARETGLSVDYTDARGSFTALGPVAEVQSVSGRWERRSDDKGGPLLSGVRVLDLSAFLSGPLAAQVLADLGADVVKVEPLTGDAHRGIVPMFCSGQRGKRALAIDLKASGAPELLDRLFRWSDVVHQSSRVGLDRRLGYDEPTVRAANPGVVYSFASGFGVSGPRAKVPTMDKLIQALAGLQAAQGGDGQPPSTVLTAPSDVAGGWISACGIIAGLIARRRSGFGQSVHRSLLASGIFLKSGAYVADGELVAGPVLDAAQTGYGATYRIYRCRDDRWLALVIADAAAWRRLREVLGEESLPVDPPALRRRGEGQQAEEGVLEAIFAGDDAAAWVRRLKTVGLSVELVVDVDRPEFISRLLDDPVNRQLGRTVSYPWGSQGRLDQPARPIRFGPDPRPQLDLLLPETGEHTSEVLLSLGVGPEEQVELARSGTILSSPSRVG